MPGTWTVESNMLLRNSAAWTWNNTDVGEAPTLRARGPRSAAEKANGFTLPLSRFGGHSTSKTPDPIPNSAVKCRRANGTASQDVGE